ncbi:aldolase catalytic domain-containing protein [Bacteroides sp. ET71]|uniref:aldolase catalytic domain-containing protein n=1 Tax=Bacteroides sp. ET71 TaxID=2939421 RepID=UPI0020119AE0|nr:aldolase catalytic domain-containing protein [Bacteroides sp. ET71]MCL1614939.1 aldolase catalytic domain-containing protein [Bacteroides sp. ET71]
MKIRILDCTFRDGGYYTNWDFEDNLVDAYIIAMNKLPVDYLEIGYRNNPVQEYIGKFGYTPFSVLKHLRDLSNKKLVVMLNEKSVIANDLDKLLLPIQGLVDMVRIAVAPERIEQAIVLSKIIKSLGLGVGVNVMYLSKWKENNAFLSKLSQIEDYVDLFCMVDSFGGITPKELRRIFCMVRKMLACQIGFHGHNNLQLGLINTLTAIECGADLVDATILGMGRGAGNLNMELLLTYLNKKDGLEVDFNILGELISVFQPLYQKYTWGTNLPYMLSGANSIPQKEVMSWCMNRTYSFNSIVRALDNKRIHVEDNAHYELLKRHTVCEVLVIGGGRSPMEHLDAIKEYLEKNPHIAIIFATSRYVAYYTDLSNEKYYCLVGNEAKRLAANLSSDKFNGICILPPYPRLMGTEVPEFAENCTYELPSVDFINCYKDSCTVIALQTALFFNASIINLVGYDGYQGESLSAKDSELAHENSFIFSKFPTQNVVLRSLTPTSYSELNVESIYQFL